MHLGTGRLPGNQFPRRSEAGPVAFAVLKLMDKERYEAMEKAWCRKPSIAGMHASLLQELIEVGNQDGANIGELFWLELPPRSADAFSESINEIGGCHDRA